jgi:hypothetical protein
MAKVVCVLYDDPVSGYPKSYPRDGLPKIEKYPDGQTLPTPKGIDVTPASGRAVCTTDERNRWSCHLHPHWTRRVTLDWPATLGLGAGRRLFYSRHDGHADGPPSRRIEPRHRVSGSLGMGFFSFPGLERRIDLGSDRVAIQQLGAQNPLSPVLVVRVSFTAT